MNRFEMLMAPPSLSSRELGIHLKMHSEIPAGVSASCRNELVNVAVRLHDELTTVRFGRMLSSDPEPEEYREALFSLTGALASPIDWKFFAEEFDAFQEQHPGLLSAGQMQTAIKGLSDPWRVQAWAAQALRVAQNAETEDPRNAAAAWKCAVQLYTSFFARADVTQSHTYRLLTDPSAQASCRAAWTSFLPDEVQALAGRLTDYASRQQAESVSAVRAALGTPEVSVVNPKAAAAAKAAAEQAYLEGIRTSSTLRAALRMYQDAPPSPERDRALTGAMASETRKLAQGFGEVAVIEECGRALHLGQGTDDGIGALLRAAREDFYEAALALTRVAVNDSNATPEQRKLAIRVAAFVPRDHVAGKDVNGTVLKAGDVLDNLKRVDAPSAGISQSLSGGGSRGPVPRTDGSGSDTASRLERLVREYVEAPSGSLAEKNAMDDLTSAFDEWARTNGAEPATLRTLERLVDAFLEAPSGSRAETRAQEALAGFMASHRELPPSFLEFTLAQRMVHRAQGGATSPSPGRRSPVRVSASTASVVVKTIGWVVNVLILVAWGFLLRWLWTFFSGSVVVQIIAVVLGILIPLWLLGALGRWAMKHSGTG